MPELREHSPDPCAHRDHWLVALDTGGTFTDLVARAPDGAMRRVKVPSDGSLSATLTAAEGARIRFAPAAGLLIPDGFLVGWRLGGAEGPEVSSQHGDELVLTRAIDHGGAPPSAGAPLRLVRAAAPIDAPRLGLHLVTRTPLDQPLPAMELRLSTTRGTNALLEGRGAAVGVLVSEGLRGVVEIGDQTRPELFARVPVRTAPLATDVRAIPERSLADGTVERRADPSAVDAMAGELAARGCDSIVVSLAHALSNEREREIAAGLRARGVRAIAARDVAAHPRLLTRTETACIHARIEPILGGFLADATLTARDARTFVFTSAGVLQRGDRLLARDTLYSGPAGGARAVAEVARRHGIADAVGFDMGGTSTDVSRTTAGEVALRGESRVGHATVAAPSVAIDSVAAGGGSICSVRDGLLEVGPQSAGANPGPACYGRGGPLTITDVNLLAGRLATGAGALGVDRARAQERFDAACLEPTVAGRGLNGAPALQGFLDVADARMALAIETLCVRDGVDPRGHALIAFGGAGGQHACAIADRLGLGRVVFPRFAGFLSAEGVLAAVPARFATVPVLETLEACSMRLAAVRELAIERARADLAADGFSIEDPDGTARRERNTGGISVQASLRLTGQESAIAVPFGSPAQLVDRFKARFRDLFGYAPPARAIEVVSLEARVSAPWGSEHASAHAAGRPSSARPESLGTTQMLVRGAFVDARLLSRDALVAGDSIEGPAIITDVGETVVLDEGWRARVDATGDLVAERTRACEPRAESAGQELFAARLESIALSMGSLLERTALSPNIRDRLDFSCAVLDAEGRLIQNAPHLPVHLGALGACTRAVMAAIELTDGDIAVTNHPAFGGSHLPDVTTVAPVFDRGRRVGFVAVRAHHAEIGGTRPGSFPPDARSLAEEGVVLAPFLAVRGGKFDASACRARFASGPHPSRNPDENLADLEAQIAATRHGVAKLAALARELGHETRDRFTTACETELSRAEAALRGAVLALGPASRESVRRLDDGSEIRARVEPAPTGRSHCIRISFAGSGPVHPRNFNAPLAVTRAATLYALRLLVDRPIPMNEGLLRAVDLDVPLGMLNPPFTADASACPPVVAGNVETSQSVVATLLECLDIAAESQSTMNNVLFGNERFTIYETLGGGAGAGRGRSGASAVHVHMSNTRLTDIDVLERRAPVVIRRFEVRRGSGGDGAFRGGDGLVRSYEFRAPVSLSFFASRRKHAPRGLGLGGTGATGRQHAVLRGVATELGDSVLSLDLLAGDQFTVETPGGGGAR